MNKQESQATWAAVIVNYSAAAYLDSCLRALSENQIPPDEIVVVDNASNDDSLADLAGWPQVVVEASSRNLGFAGGANRGIERTDAPIVLVLNPDVEVDATFGDKLLHTFGSDEKLGAAGAKLRYPDGKVLQHAGGELDRRLLTTQHRGYQQPDQGQWDNPANVDFVTGGAMALRRAAFDQVCGFDERFWPAYYEDVDICLRLRAAGWQVRYQPQLTAVHVESVTLARSLDYFRYYHRNRIRFALKHLTAEDWWRGFIPAELGRLRGEISAIAEGSWPVTSGVSAIEELARISRLPDDSAASLLSGEALLTMIQALDEVRSRRIVVPDSTSKILDRLRDGWVRRIFGRQQVFNDAVTRALEAQDRVNRELTAQIVLTLLDLSWRDASADYSD
ncbi:MAG TPA: glycosyltransferase family 2 protein [Nitrolancea sp.]|nr:glycosyltransferase family 2 protein [Nitrolancea sp.]